MAALVAAQGLGSDGEPETAKKSRRRRPRFPRGTGATASRTKHKSNEDGEDSDPQDGDFSVASSDSESSDDAQFMGDEVVGNAEVRQHFFLKISNSSYLPSPIQLASVLPSKSIPTTGRGSGSHTRKRKATEAIEVEDEDSHQQIFARSSSPADSSVILEEIPATRRALPSASGTKQAKDKRVCALLFNDAMA
jgi:hypothetical protein